MEPTESSDFIGHNSFFAHLLSSLFDTLSILKSSYLHPVFGPPFTPKPLFQPQISRIIKVSFFY
jgi:hypothetical protein